MKVRDHEVGLVVLEIDRNDGEHHARKAADGEQEQERQRKQHGRFERQRTAPQRRSPVEHLHARGHRNQHGGHHVEQLRGDGHPVREHVMAPDDERQERDRGDGVNHRRRAEQGFAREGRQDFRDDAEGRQNHDVHLGMAEEPEDVFEHHRVAAAGRIEETGLEEMIGQQHGDCAGQHRHHGDQQISGDQPGPGEQRHFQQTHARRAHVHDGHDDIDRTHDRGRAHHVNGEDQHGESIAGLQGQRRIQSPARRGHAARHEVCREQQSEGEGQDPEAEIVHARQGHVRRADLHGNHPIGQADECRHDGAENHDERVIGGQLIEKHRVHQLQAGFEQLGANQHGHGAADEEHDQAEHQVHGADVFVIGGENPALDARRGLIMVMIIMGVIGMLRGVGRLRLGHGRIALLKNDCVNSAKLARWAAVPPRQAQAPPAPATPLA